VKNSIGKCSLVASNVIVYAFLFIPLVMVIGISFSPTYQMVFPPQGLSLRWFKYILDQKEFVDSFFVSVVVAFFASLVALLIGILVSLAIVRYHFRWKTAIENIFMMPIILPTVVTGVAMLQFFSLVGYGDFWMRLILGHIIVTIPYTIRSISASLYGVNRRLEEASLIMGANPLQTFKNILLPLIKEGVTRFGERLREGVIVDTEDGSIDELLARRRASSPVITAEIVLRSETTPPLSERVSAYLDVLDAFFGR